MKHEIAMLVVALAIAVGCTPDRPQAAQEKPPAPSTVFYGESTGRQIYEFRLPDGTVCVTVWGDYRTQSLSCDFSSRRQ